MRVITTHHDGHGLNESLQVEAADEIGPGGANHLYIVTTKPGKDNSGTEVARIQFQNGARGEKGSTPGVVEAAVLAIVCDRMEQFQAGPYPSRESAIVLTKCQEAIHWLRHRADGRAARGVLGKEVK